MKYITRIPNFVDADHKVFSVDSYKSLGKIIKRRFDLVENPGEYGYNVINEQELGSENKVLAVKTGDFIIGHLIGEKSKIEALHLEYESLRVSKGTRIKLGNITSFVVSINTDRTELFVVDHNNNIDSIDIFEDFNVIDIDSDSVSDLASCLLGLEDDRFTHWEESSKETAENMVVDKKYESLREDLINKCKDLSPHTIESNSKEIKVFVNELENPRVLEYSLDSLVKISIKN